MIDEATQTTEASLDALLVIWHRYSSGYRFGRAYPGTAAGCEQYRPSRQYDSENGAMDSDADASLAGAVDCLVQKMVDPYRNAISINARNLSNGLSVWSSPRLPFDPVERSRIIHQARQQMTKLMQAEGLL